MVLPVTTNEIERWELKHSHLLDLVGSSGKGDSKRAVSRKVVADGKKQESGVLLTALRERCGSLGALAYKPASKRW